MNSQHAGEDPISHYLRTATKEQVLADLKASRFDDYAGIGEKMPLPTPPTPAGAGTETPKEVITLKWDGETGDGKRAFVVAEENDGWKDLRIEVDTDDCDSDHAKAVMGEVIRRCNAANALAPAVMATETKDRIHVLVDRIYTAYCDYESRDKNKDRFRNLVSDFLSIELLLLRRQAEADRAKYASAETVVGEMLEEKKRWLMDNIFLRSQLAGADKLYHALDNLLESLETGDAEMLPHSITAGHAAIAAMWPSPSINHGARDANQNK